MLLFWGGGVFLGCEFCLDVFTEIHSSICCEMVYNATMKHAQENDLWEKSLLKFKSLNRTIKTSSTALTLSHSQDLQRQIILLLARVLS